MTYEEEVKRLEIKAKEEAIKRLKTKAEMRCYDICGRHRGELSICDCCKVGECFNIAIESIEKQIPKKPVDIEVVGTYKDGEIIAIGKCPVCFEHIGRATSKHGCCNCLQALDWSVEE